MGDLIVNILSAGMDPSLATRNCGGSWRRAVNAFG
jgi:hypothetical protein